MEWEVILGLGTPAGVASFLVSLFAYRKSISEERAQLYLLLRTRYLSSRTEIDKEAFSKDYDISKIDNIKPGLQRYWYNAFDEWYSTNVLNGGRHQALWNDYFKWAIANTLKYPGPVQVLEDMVGGEVSFGKYRKPFLNTISALNKELDSEEKAKNEFSWGTQAE